MARSKPIRTRRLLLRAFRPCDAADLFAYARDPQVGPEAGWAPHKDLAASRDVLSRNLMRTGTWAVVYSPENKVIGSVGLHNTAVSRADASGNALEIGYVLSRDYWGSGYATEAAAAALDYAFRRYFVHTVWCAHFDYNARSARVLQKLGFQYRYDQASVIESLGGKEVVEKVYSLSKERFYALFPGYNPGEYVFGRHNTP